MDQVTEEAPPGLVSSPLDSRLSITELMGQVLKKERKSFRQRREQQEVLQEEEGAAGSPPDRGGATLSTCCQKLGGEMALCTFREGNKVCQSIGCANKAGRIDHWLITPSLEPC